MTRPQLWVAAVLVLFLLLFFLEKGTKRSDVQQKPTPMGMMQTETSSTGKAATPEQLVVSLGCTGCHGTDLSGTKMAPDLHNVKDFWSRDQLINYLRNPSSYMSSERMKNYQAKYPGRMMPSFSNIDVKQLGEVADYLLKMKKQ